jgi:hypothetical protein
VLLKYSKHVLQAINKAGFEVCARQQAAAACAGSGRLAHLRPPAAPQLQGKTDQRFVEASFRLARDCLGIRTVLTPALFLEQARRRRRRGAPARLLLGRCIQAPASASAWHGTPLARRRADSAAPPTRPPLPPPTAQGYAERKILLLCDVIHACRRIHSDAARRERLSLARPPARKVGGGGGASAARELAGPAAAAAAAAAPKGCGELAAVPWCRRRRRPAPPWPCPAPPRPPSRCGRGQGPLHLPRPADTLRAQRHAGRGCRALG